LSLSALVHLHYQVLLEGCRKVDGGGGAVKKALAIEHAEKLVEVGGGEGKDLAKESATLCTIFATSSPLQLEQVSGLRVQ
jgi:hypothetical protein